MRSTKALLIAGMLAAGLPSLAHAEWYTGADVGASYVPSASVSGVANTNTSYNWGLAALGQVGYSYGAPKAEFEIGYRTNDVDKISSVSGSGSESALSLMVNGVYDFMPTSSWHPFVGVGVGGADVRADSVKRGGAPDYSGDNWQFAYQGFAGIGYDIAPNWVVKAQYRYFATLDSNVTIAGSTTSHNLGYQDHAGLLGVTYKFNTPKPQVAEAAPAPMPMPMPAPAPVAKPAPAPMKNFLVFFDFDKANITPEAAKIITQAAAAAKNPGITRVALTGHTDLAGSDKYNMALSLKRADAVKDSLVRQGVPANEITVVAKGKSDPLVPTKDGVREPQNRRVEIVLQ